MTTKTGDSGQRTVSWSALEEVITKTERVYESLLHGLW